ncbi:MAG: M20/M25/M40 family metallo-hydrolase [Lentimicrobium sp.]|nr:M20/M25/M40 family metallo-hydrolase [Lentimicrobium sp.]
MNNLRSGILFTFFVLIFFSQALFSQDAVNRLKSHISYLASDVLEGRKAGTTGDSLAAVYIRDQFRAIGAELPGSDGFQYFTLVSGVSLGETNNFSLNQNLYTESVDFTPFSFSSKATVDAEVVFAGFGITGSSGDLSWDDYAGLDVTNKWVLVLRGDPEPENQNSAFIPLATDRSKALAARDKGAAGLLLVSPSGMEKKDTPLDLSYDKSVSDAGIPVLSVTRKLASDILHLPATSIDSLEKIMINELRTVNFKTGNIVNATADVIREKVVSRNVMAMIKGADKSLKDEYIVIGAHYDHLGMGGNGSGSRVPDVNAVHGGADDNASGVASLFELAEWFGKKENRPSRSLLFVAFGAEEMGLLGARHFVANSPVNLQSIKAMINMDMVGRLKTDSPVVTISGTGTFTVADSLIDRLAATAPFEIKKVADGYGPSDHAAFYGEGVPVLFVTTGAHGDYHTPDDKVENINFEGLIKVTDFVKSLGSEIANLTPTPVFREAGSRNQAGHYGRNLKVTLGIMPDVSGGETNGGMKVEGVRKEGPAEKAGMLKGDIITAINGLPVANIYDYMSRLGKLRPGEIANIEVNRNGITEVLIVQL